MDSSSEVAWRRRFVDGDPQAIREIHDRYAGRMFAVAYRVLGDRGLAADAVQQALLQAWRAAKTYDVARPIEPWLFVITRRASVDVFRRHRERVTALDVDAVKYQSVPAPDQQTLEQTWLIWRVRSALDELRETDRSIIKLAFYENLTHTEIASRLDIPVGTVKSRLFRAQRKLSAALPDLRDDVHTDTVNAGR